MKPSPHVALLFAALFTASLVNAETSPADGSARLQFIRTPQPAPEPRVHSAQRIGARPNHPFRHYIPATGERPMTFTVSGLPASLTLDVANGVISGTAPSASVYPLRITAANSLGSDTLTVELVIGDALALTPPMGWNTYNAFRMRIDDPLIRLQADAMVSTGLINYGYSYINIDDGWQGQRTPDGSIQGNTRFPDMPALGAYLHAKGLKFGLYSSPGPRTCADYEGSYGHEVQDARTYATWGVDFIKYDWCSYDAIAQNLAAEKYAALLPQHANRIRAIVAERIPLTASRIRPRPPEQSARIRELTDELNALSAAISPEQRAQITREIHVHPYRVFGQALAAVDRDIIYSLCQYGMEDPGEWAPAIGGHLWRTTRDITPNRRAIERITQQQVGHEKHAAPGRWNDPDMLEIGNGTLTPDEMHSHMTQWCILAAPLLIGTDLTKIDPLTFSILANHEILAVNQDPLGTQGRRVRQTGNADIWTKPLADGTLAVALFNRGDSPLTITVPMADLKLPAGGSTGVPAPHPIRDLWRHKDLPAATTVTADVAPYSAELFKVGHPTTKSDR